MTWLRKLPNSQRHPPGLEWRILRNMPRILLVGSLLPALVAALARILPTNASALESKATLSLVDIYAIAAVFLHWTLVLTVSIACVIVWLMKGPAYVADAYELPDDHQSPSRPLE